MPGDDDCSCPMASRCWLLYLGPNDVPIGPGSSADPDWPAWLPEPSSTDVVQRIVCPMVIAAEARQRADRYDRALEKQIRREKRKRDKEQKERLVRSAERRKKGREDAAERQLNSYSSGSFMEYQIFGSGRRVPPLPTADEQIIRPRFDRWSSLDFEDEEVELDG